MIIHLVQIAEKRTPEGIDIRNTICKTFRLSWKCQIRIKGVYNFSENYYLILCEYDKMSPVNA